VIVSPFRCAVRCSDIRSAFSVERIAENMSPLHQTLVSIDSDTGMPYCSTCSVGACP
jgi:hypothetical protein